MVTLLDVGVLLGVLLAMLLTSHPKRAAIAACALVSAAAIVANLRLNGWPVFMAISAAEVAAVLGLIVSARHVAPKHRAFFRMMAAMLLASGLNTWALLEFRDVAGAYRRYVDTSHLIAVVHVGLMLGFSDGLRALGGHLISRTFGQRGVADVRHIP